MDSWQLPRAFSCKKCFVVCCFHKFYNIFSGIVIFVIDLWIPFLLAESILLRISRISLRNPLMCLRMFAMFWSLSSMEHFIMIFVLTIQAWHIFDFFAGEHFLNIFEALASCLIVIDGTDRMHWLMKFILRDRNYNIWTNI